MGSKPTEIRELVEEAKAELAFWEDLGVVEQMRQDASGWVGLVERLVEQHEVYEIALRAIANGDAPSLAPFFTPQSIAANALSDEPKPLKRVTVTTTPYPGKKTAQT